MNARVRRGTVAIMAGAFIGTSVGVVVPSIATAAPSSATAQNGMKVIDKADTTRWVVGGQEFWTANGNVTKVLKDFTQWFHQNVESVSITKSTADDWSWGPLRSVRGGSKPSTHSAGAAIDLNATLHPMGQRDTFTPSQVQKIRAKIKASNGKIKWGGDFSGPNVDEMHFEYIP